MSISILTGRHLSWLACSLLVLNGPAVHVCVADDLSASVNAELLNLSKAFRGLDQSYQYRGMSSRLASTAGSVFVDWEAKGVPPEHRYPAVAPAPVLVGCAEPVQHCPETDCACSHHLMPQPDCSDCATESHIQLHGSGSGCAATIGIPLHPRCNDCTATIGIPLHPHAFARQGCGCEKCQSDVADCQPTEVCESGCDDDGPCHDCFVVEQYRNGCLTRTLVPCDRCKAPAVFE